VDPFTGRNQFEYWHERIAWHLFTVGVLGLLLLVLLISIKGLGELQPSVDAAPPTRVATPANTEPIRVRSDHGCTEPPRRSQPTELLQGPKRPDASAARVRARVAPAREGSERA